MKKGPHGKVPEVFILHALKAAAPMRNKPINKDIQGIFFLILWHFSTFFRKYQRRTFAPTTPSYALANRYCVNICLLICSVFQKIVVFVF